MERERKTSKMLSRAVSLAVDERTQLEEATRNDASLLETLFARTPIDVLFVNNRDS